MARDLPVPIRFLTNTVRQSLSFRTMSNNRYYSSTYSVVSFLSTSLLPNRIFHGLPFWSDLSSRLQCKVRRFNVGYQELPVRNSLQFVSWSCEKLAILLSFVFRSWYVVNLKDQRQNNLYSFEPL